MLFRSRMSKEIQQNLLDTSMKAAADVINEVANANVPGLEYIRYDGNNYTCAILIINKDFESEANGEVAFQAILKLGCYMPWVQVYQGRGMATDVAIYWCYEDENEELIEPPAGVLYFPETIGDLLNR